MKAAIVYYSRHHGNTKKLLDAMAKRCALSLIDVAEQDCPDLSGYDVVGFASGIYYSKFHKTVLRAAKECLPQGKKVFFVYTYGAEKTGYTDAIATVVQGKNAEILGEYGCFGFNTFGPFKLIGGMAKGHPDRDELDRAASFCANLLEQ